uniref:Uncharacterized protein n=1 Tax=Strombidium rassoulzadegani TaxID=1082188 RepID=A0A7S3CSD5_9SPIT
MGDYCPRSRMEASGRGLVGLFLSTQVHGFHLTRCGWLILGLRGAHVGHLFPLSPELVDLHVVEVELSFELGHEPLPLVIVDEVDRERAHLLLAQELERQFGF